MIDFSKCCGGNGMKPERHCQDCDRTWGRTKKELVELIERGRAEYATVRKNLESESDLLVRARAHVGDLAQKLDAARRDASNASNNWSIATSDLTAERAAHKATRERLAMELKQVAVDKLLIEDLENRREFWQKKAVGAVFHGAPDPLAYPVIERAPHAPVGPRREPVEKCICWGSPASQFPCRSPNKHGPNECRGACLNGQSQCKDCFLPF